MSIKLNPAKPKAAEPETIKVADPIPGLTTEQDTIVVVADETQAVLDGGTDAPDAVVAPAPQEPSPESTSDVTFDQKERVPSDWVIVPVADKIEARNNKTGKVFVGTTKEFNALLRG